MNRDTKLIAYFDAKFERIDDRFQETQEQIRENHGLISAVQDQVGENRGLISAVQDQVSENRGLITAVQDRVRENRSLIATTQDQVVSLQGQFTSLRGQVRANQSEIRKNRKQNQETQVILEDVRSKLQILAEGHAALDEKIDRRFDQAESRRRELRDHFDGLLKASFSHLSRRDDELEERVELLEAATG